MLFCVKKTTRLSCEMCLSDTVEGGVRYRPRDLRLRFPPGGVAGALGAPGITG